MIRNCAMLVFLSIAVQLIAQGGFRSRLFLPGALNHSSRAVFESSPGNYIAAGFTLDTMDGYQVNQLTMMGLDAEGKLKWVKKYGSTQFIYLNNGFIIKTFYKQGDHIYYAGCVRDTSNKQIGVLIKFDLNGDTVWQKIYRDPDPLEDVIPQMVTGSVDGGFLITGFFQNWSANHYRRCLLIKTDRDGNELWRKKIAKIAPDTQDGKAIVQDSASKKIVIVGYQYMDVGQAKSYDNILILDSLGDKLSPYSQYAYNLGVAFDLLLTRDKTCLVVGINETPKDAITNYLTSYIAKFDFNKTLPKIWNKLYLPKTLRAGFGCIRELENGDIFVAGPLDSSSITNTLQNDYVRFTRLDTAGNILSNRYYNYKYNDQNKKNSQTVMSLELTSDGGWIVAVAEQNLPRPNPFFFVKYDSTGCDSTEAYCRSRDSLILLGLNRPHSDNAIQFEVYPNPASDFVKIYVNAPEGEDMRLEVSDLTGRNVGSYNMHSKGDLQINTGKYQNGIYFITLYSGGNALGVRKLLVQH